MGKDTLILLLRNKKVKDYSFLALFFFVFSFFVFFAIRPNILTVFALQKERDDLSVVNANYESVILSIVQIQSLLEQYRDKVAYLDDAIPSTPQVNKVIDDMQKDSSRSGMIISQAAVSKLSLKEDTQKEVLKNFDIHIQSDGDFTQAKQFIDGMIAQRRLKMIKEIIISKQIINSTASGALGTQLTIESYYL